MSARCTPAPTRRRPWLPLLQQLLLLLLLLLLAALRPPAARAQDNDVADACPPDAEIQPCRCTMRGDDLQIWCSHSDLARVLAGLQAVGKRVTRAVDELILENNLVPALPGRAFAALRVTRLMLRGNGLERVAPAWLSGLEDSLLELYVVEPRLRALPPDSLEQLRALEAVTLHGGVMKRLPRFSGLPRLRYLQLQSAGLQELSPLAFRALPDLEQLHVTLSPHVTRLEAGLLHDLPRLRLLNVSWCGLAWLHPRALARLPALATLDLTGNRLPDAGVVGRAVRDLPALAVLNLDHNLVDRLAEASFVDMPSLREVHLVGNRITEIQRGAFHRVAALRKLDLSHNLIRRVHPEAFLQRSDSGVEEVWLVRNALAHAAELRALLDALPRLRFLDASHNFVEELPYGALRGHPTLEQLHLDHNRLHRLERDSFAAMPALRELRLRNNSISGYLDGPYWSLPALKGLDLADNYLRRVDARLLANLPSLRRLDVSGNDITEVDVGAFLDTPALETLNLSGNAIVTLHPITFRHLVNLYEVDVGWNRLRELVPGLPRAVEQLRMPRNQVTQLPLSPPASLPQLRLLDLTGNGLTRLATGALSGMPQLRALLLGENALQRLEDGSLAGLHRLQLLDLHDNRMLGLGARALRDLAALRDLDLRANRLDSLPPELLRRAEQLRRLDLSRNQLAELPDGLFDAARDVQELDASRNALSAFPAAVAGLPALHWLDLSYNRLAALPGAAILQSLQQLAELRLARNRLRELPAGAFRALPRLALLDLSSNELRAVAPGAVHALPELRALRLAHNRLAALPAAALADLPQLLSAELQHNALAEVAPHALQSVPRLLLLNLSHNALPALDRAGLRGLSSLEVLDLSHNRLARVTQDSLTGMEWLVELKMDNNNICSIQGAPFNSMPRLRVLSLRNNRMTTLRERAFQRLRGSAALLDVAGNPLACSCSLAWLQAWLHELEPRGQRTARQRQLQLDDADPRCADGSPLRGQRLSRLDCPEGRAAAEPPPPPADGCEVDVAAPLLGTSQVLSTWMEIKESTPLPQGALSPEDSDYFYDEYVEYQYDENATVPSNNTNSNIISATTLSSLVPVVQQQADSAQYSTISPHYISGDTPTLYAGTRREPNKTKVPPLQIPHPSPPTSGLTFFGIPLPSINLGSLWGSARKADPKHSDVKFIGNRGKVEMLQPSPVPHLQSGFIPMLPESGGFMPIVNPLLAQRNDHKAHGSHLNAQQQLKLNYSLWDTPGTNKTVQLTDSTNISSYDDEQGILSHRGPGLLPVPPPLPEEKELIPAAGTAFPRTIGSQGHKNVPQAQPANFLNALALHTSYSQTTQNPPSQPIPLSDIDTSLNAATLLANELNKVPVSTVNPPPKLQVEGAAQNKHDHTQHAESIEYEQTTLPPTTLGSGWGFHWRGKTPTPTPPDLARTTAANSDITTMPPVTGNILGLISAQSEGLGQNVQPPSSLSALLVPGGQQPQFRPPAGKPTITKVTVSPGTSPSNTDPQPVEEYLIGPEPNANSHTTEILSSSKTQSSDNSSMEWYFKNYNRTNLKPYVGPGKRVITGQASRICASLSAFVLVLITQWL